MEYWAQFPGGAYHVNIIELISLGFTVGIMTGFWGMGGRFLMTPLLNVFFNIPYNVAVGSDICQMVGTSSMNMVKFKIMGTVDYKLACWMIMGAIGGVECGAQMLEFLKSANDLILVDKPLKVLFLVLSAIYAALLFWIGTLVYGESKAAYDRPKEMGNLTDFQLDMTARLQTLRLPPHDLSSGFGYSGSFLLGGLGRGFPYGPPGWFSGGWGQFYRSAGLDLYPGLSHGGRHEHRPFCKFTGNGLWHVLSFLKG